MRGSSGFTVTPSVVGVAGGVAYGPAATSPAVAVGVAPPPTLVPGVAVAIPPAPLLGERSHAARMVLASAALPAISETRRKSSRRVICPSRKSSTCSSMKYRWVSLSSPTAHLPLLEPGFRRYTRAGGVWLRPDERPYEQATSARAPAPA